MQQNQGSIDEYIKKLILAYFKEFGKEYDIFELGNIIGISMIQLTDHISELIQDDFLRYENDLLQLTLAGRLYLNNTRMEDYSFESDVSILYEKDKLDIKEVYCVQQFSKRKWRGK